MHQRYSLENKPNPKCAFRQLTLTDPILAEPAVSDPVIAEPAVPDQVTEPTVSNPVALDSMESTIQETVLREPVSP